MNPGTLGQIVCATIPVVGCLALAWQKRARR